MDTLTQIGEPAPSFTLPDLDGEPHSLDDYRDHVVVLNFWSAECHWCERSDEELVHYLSDWGESVRLLSIAPNANEPPALLREVAAARGLPIVLRDTERQVADTYEVEVTPHLFVIDPEGILRYQGAFDDVTFRKREPSVRYLHQAVEAVLAGKRPQPANTPAYGCVLIREAI
jgi:peroxiredoxin